MELALAERADARFCGGDLYEGERVTQGAAAFLRVEFALLAPIRVLPTARGTLLTGSH